MYTTLSYIHTTLVIPESRLVCLPPFWTFWFSGVHTLTRTNDINQQSQT